jgi:hypothetical protein
LKPRRDGRSPQRRLGGVECIWNLSIRLSLAPQAPEVAKNARHSDVRRNALL